MAKINYSDREWLTDERPPASQGTLDGSYLLACAVLCQAVKDLHDRRYPARAADALLWLASGEAALWADELGFYIPDHRLVILAARAEV